MKSSYKINLILLIILTSGFGFICLSGINHIFFVKINSFTAYANPIIWSNLTFMGDTLTASAFMLLFIRKRPDLVWSGIIATIVATLIVNILKYYLDIPRPPAIFDNNTINIIGPVLYKHSFPSGHAVTIFTLTGILMFYFRSLFLRISLILLALLIGISRIAVGVHWPVDVLAGAGLGSLCSMIGVYCVTKLGWNKIRPVQIVTGFILISSTFYLLLFYDCKYEQAVYLQYFFAASVLVIGIREYYLLLTTRR